MHVHGFTARVNVWRDVCVRVKQLGNIKQKALRWQHDQKRTIIRRALSGCSSARYQSQKLECKAFFFLNAITLPIEMQEDNRCSL